MRIEKVNQVIKREVGNMILLGEINDPRVKLVTIVSADVSKDLQHARIKFSVLSDDPNVIKNAIKGMDSARGFVRKTIASRVVLRYIPEFQFIFDKGIQHAAKIDATLEEIKHTLITKDHS